jgi:hypothetical protein
MQQAGDDSTDTRTVRIDSGFAKAECGDRRARVVDKLV